MKYLIRILARYSGVERSIRDEQRMECARQLHTVSYWFTNKKKYGEVYPILWYAGQAMKNGFKLNGDKMRSVYDTAQEVNESKTTWADMEFGVESGEIIFD